MFANIHEIPASALVLYSTISLYSIYARGKLSFQDPLRYTVAMDINLDEVKAFFSRDRYAMAAGIVIDEAEREKVRCSMAVKDMHKNAGGNIQGGAIFTLADFTFGVHSNLGLFSGGQESLEGGLTVGQSCSISYLKSSRGTRLIAESACLHRGRTMSVYRIVVSDDLGNLVAEMHGNGFTTERPGKG